MKFTLYAYLSKHPFQFAVVKRWVGLGLPVPSALKLRIANEIHAEMIARLLGAVVNEGNVTLQRAKAIHYDLGLEIAGQVQEFLEVDPQDARSLSRIIDFLHGVLCISGKTVVVSSRERAVSHWTSCPLSARLLELKEGGGPYYCHLYQEIYRGVLSGINTGASANDLAVTQSQGCSYCELETRVD